MSCGLRKEVKRRRNTMPRAAKLCTGDAAPTKALPGEGPEGHGGTMLRIVLR